MNKKTYLYEYYNKIKEKKIIVGQELYIELTNLIRDLKNKEYYYDTKKANLIMDFMENCIRLTKSPFYNKPMKLMLWQKAFIEVLYSFKMSKDGTDRFKKAILLIARKNTKSELCAAIATAEWIIGNAGSDIVCSSNDDKQASIVYDTINTMRQLIDQKDFYTKKNQMYIINKLNNSKIFKLSDRTKNKEGRNIDFAIIDETHEIKEEVIIKSIEQSQSLKDNPKRIEITTEGFVIDGHLDNELRYARKVINREEDGISSKRYLAWLYTQDSEKEVWMGNRKNRLWEKSNPSLGIVKKYDYLEEQVDSAKRDKATRIFTLLKDFNIKQSSNERWLELTDYDYKAVYDINEFRGSICIGAVDLSETTDMTAIKILLMKANDSTKYIYSHYFIPENKLLDGNDDKIAGAKYEEWGKKQLLTITEGNDIDLSLVADFFKELYERYDIRLWKCGYDQKFAKEWLNRMEDYGWTKKEDLIMITQNAYTLSNAMKLCEADFKHKLINYNDNEVDKWCFSNAGIKVDIGGNALCVKVEPKKRIDGAVTLIMLYEMYRRYRTEYKTLIGES